MPDPTFEKFEILTSSEIWPEFHCGVPGQGSQKSFDDEILTSWDYNGYLLSRRSSSGNYSGLNEEYFKWIDALENSYGSLGRFKSLRASRSRSVGKRASCASVRHRPDLDRLRSGLLRGDEMASERIEQSSGNGDVRGLSRSDLPNC